MTQETKRNLIFLAILVPLMAPGGIILFMKKLNPDERYIGAPDPVRLGTPYIDRLPTGPQMRRVVPVGVGQFVAEELRRRTGTPWAQPMLEPQHGLLPLMSDQRLFQWVYLASVEGVGKAHVLVWSERAPREASGYTLSTPAGPAKVLDVAVVEQSDKLQRALQDAGLIKPARNVRWILAEVPPGTTELTLGFGDETDTARSVVPAPSR
jgi:hypothetical protein